MEGYLHARIALYFPFVVGQNAHDLGPEMQQELAGTAAKCREDSRKLIREMFTAYKSHLFQPGWQVLRHMNGDGI